MTVYLKISYRLVYQLLVETETGRGPYKPKLSAQNATLSLAIAKFYSLIFRFSILKQSMHGKDEFIDQFKLAKTFAFLSKIQCVDRV